jgi:hypothetical protein
VTRAWGREGADASHGHPLQRWQRWMATVSPPCCICTVFLHLETLASRP